MPSRAPFLARWSPRIGRKAARLHLLTGPSTTLGIWSAPIWVILYVIGQGWSKMAAYVVAGVGFACLAFAAICMHLMFQALGERFGFKVTWRNAPPYRYKAFGAWCRSHGINPATGRPPGAHLATPERPLRRVPAHRANPQARRDDTHTELRAAGRQTT
ncbi:MAG: hypothetical protein ABSG36_10160 [Acidimicrobiales bacterium]